MVTSICAHIACTSCCATVLVRRSGTVQWILCLFVSVAPVPWGLHLHDLACADGLRLFCHWSLLSCCQCLPFAWNVFALHCWLYCSAVYRFALAGWSILRSLLWTCLKLDVFAVSCLACFTFNVFVCVYMCCLCYLKVANRTTQKTMKYRHVFVVVYCLCLCLVVFVW